MKKNKNLKYLSICIWAIAAFHLLFLVLAIPHIRGTWFQTSLNSSELIGVKSLYYDASLGYIDKRYEFVYDDQIDGEGQHLYQTGIGYIELDNKDDRSLKVEGQHGNDRIEVTYTRMPLVLPVTSSQKKSLIYYGVFYLGFITFYSLLIFIQLARYLGSLVSGDSINNSNLKLLYSIGILVIFQPVIAYASQSIEMSWIRNHFTLEGYDIVSTYSFQMYTFGLGIFFIAIAETIRQSIRMKKEQELTI